MTLHLQTSTRSTLLLIDMSTTPITITKQGLTSKLRTTNKMHREQAKMS